MRIGSLFSGAGGLDLGFEIGGFKTIWANEKDPALWSTYRANFPDVHLHEKSIEALGPESLIPVDGIIGGPPCQSWSTAGAGRGACDQRGQLFWEYIRIIRQEKPRFFVAENVPGMLTSKHRGDFDELTTQLRESGYTLSWSVIDAANYGVPQHRKRLFIVGYRLDLGLEFTFANLESVDQKKTVADGLAGVSTLVLPASQTQSLGEEHPIGDYYSSGSYSPHFMSRNRVLNYGLPSKTITASARHVPLHPSAPPMVKIAKDKMSFVEGAEEKYRRITVAEAAALQSFPKHYNFRFANLQVGYRLVGNAVPPLLGKAFADAIRKDLSA